VRDFNVVVLLLECLLLSSLAGLAYAQETPVTVTTDKTTYSPGDTVYVTVTAMYSNYGCAVASRVYVLCLSVVMTPVPSPACDYSCPATSAILLLAPPAYNTNGYVAGFQGKVALQLPTDTLGGRYDIQLLACPKWIINGNQITCGGQFMLYQLPKVEIRVEGGPAHELKQG